jgi:hypothetical protein
LRILDEPRPRNKRSQHGRASVASEAGIPGRRGSTGREKAGIGAARADRQSDLFAAFWAVAFVGGFASIDVDPRVRIATDELNADKPPADVSAPSAPRIICQIESLASHAVIVTPNAAGTESQ